MTKPIFRSEINNSATRAKCFLDNALCATVHRVDGFWRALNPMGAEILKTPHTIVERVDVIGYRKPQERKIEVPLGQILKQIRERTISQLA